MPIDVSILSQFKPQQSEPLLNTLAQFEQIRGARQQQEMNALQMQRAKREFAEQDFVNKLYEGAVQPDGKGVDYDLVEARAASGGYGGLVPKIREQRVKELKLRSEQEKEEFLKGKAQRELETAELDQLGSLIPNAKSPEQLRALIASSFQSPVLKNFYARMGVTEATSLQNLENEIEAQGFPATVARMSQRTEDVRKGLFKQSVISEALLDAKELMPRVTEGSHEVKGSVLQDGALTIPGVSVRERELGDRIVQLKLAARVATDKGHADIGKELLEQSKILLDQSQSMLTPKIKEYIYGQQNKGFEAYELRRAEASAPKNIIDVAGNQAAKMYIDRLGNEFERLSTAPATINNIERAKKLIPGAKPFLGSGAEAYLNTAKFLNSWLGMEFNVKGVKDAEVLRTRLFDGVLENLRKLDAQPTAEQQRILNEALGNLSTDPSALADVLNAVEERIRERVELYNSRVESAEKRGVPFPYDVTIRIPSQNRIGEPERLTAPPPAAAPPAKKSAGKPPPGIPQREWDAMDEEDRELWRKAK